MEPNSNVYKEEGPSTCPMYPGIGAIPYNQQSNSHVPEQQANHGLVAYNTNNHNNNNNNYNTNNNDYIPTQVCNVAKDCSPMTTDMCLMYPPTTSNNNELQEASGGFDWFSPMPPVDTVNVSCVDVSRQAAGNLDCSIPPSSYQMPCPMLSSLDNMACTMCYQMNNSCPQDTATSIPSASTSHLSGRGCSKCLTGSAVDTSLYSSNSGREARNRAEKNRRDRLNGCIQELSTLVPHVAESTRRVDKIAVLRFATHGLRLKHVFGKSVHSGSPYVTNSVMKMLDSFFLTLTCNGQIVLVSSNVEEYLGHCQPDLYGQNILNITHPDDREILKRQLIPTDMDSLFNVTQRRYILDDNKSSQHFQDESSLINEEERQIDSRLRKDKRSFVIRLARAGPRSEPIVYEFVLIRGSFRRSDMAPRKSYSRSFINPHLTRRSRGLYGSEEAYIMPLQTISGNDVELIAVARVLRPTTLYRTVNLSQLEYKTRHLIDGRIVDCDQRISIVAGYMKNEVCNLSPFTFIHRDDVKWVIVALRQMYDCRSSYGESTYRLFTRSGGVIYLHTKGFLEMNNATDQVQSFVCVNTLLNESEGQQLLMNMKRKYSVIINRKLPQLRDGKYGEMTFSQQQEQQQLLLPTTSPPTPPIPLTPPQQQQHPIEDLKQLLKPYETMSNVSLPAEQVAPAQMASVEATTAVPDLVDDGSIHFDTFLKCFNEIPKTLTEDNSLGQGCPEDSNAGECPEKLGQECQGNKIVTQHQHVSSSSDNSLSALSSSLLHFEDDPSALFQDLCND